jgi:predicted GIY-YIG superfamily endonuclease
VIRVELAGSDGLAGRFGADIAIGRMPYFRPPGHPNLDLETSTSTLEPRSSTSKLETRRRNSKLDVETRNSTSKLDPRTSKSTSNLDPRISKSTSNLDPRISKTRPARIFRYNTPVPWYVYLLRCGDGSLYAGSTTDVDSRLAAHRAGRGARYTRGRGPLSLVLCEPHRDRSAALRRECELKRLRRAEKLALLAPRRTARR